MKKDGHYRLPLKLINSHVWAGLSKPARTVLLVIGCYVDKYGTCSLSRPEIAVRAGYSNLYQTIDKALKELVVKYLITIKKSKGLSNRYYLTDLSRYEKKKSYFPIYRYQIKRLYWAKLRPCEKALYPVLGLKGTVNNPDIINSPEIYCRGQIKKKKDFCKWTGLNYSSFKRTLRGLEEKSLLFIDTDGNYDLFRLEVMKIKK